MSYYEKIMSLQSEVISFASDEDRHVYFKGYRDGRHAAAELAAQADETIRCMSESWQKLADMLGVEVKRDGLDVDEMARAIEGLKRNYAHIEEEWIAQINRNTMLLGMIENPPASRNQFHVLAGKYESDGEENIKFADSFNTLAEAISAAESCRGYHFCRIEHQRWKLITEEMTKALAAGEAGNGS